MKSRLIIIVLLCTGLVTPAFAQEAMNSLPGFTQPAVEQGVPTVSPRSIHEESLSSNSDSVIFNKAGAVTTKSLLGTASVLIIQDSLPWGFDSIQQILTANGIAFALVDSSQMGVIDLAPYKMVVIPSIQGDSYVGTWNSNLAWAEHYVEQGGRLWLSTTTQGGTDFLVPGGVISSHAVDYYNDITDAAHPWVQSVPNPMSGSFANHNEFTSLYPESQVVATAQTSGNPVLVDYRYGAGRILITGQPLEWAWDQGEDGGPILQYSLLDMYRSFVRPDVLIIQDSLPWGYDSIHDVLSTDGIAYDQVDSSQMGVIDLNRYKMVVVPSAQGSAFYAAWNANIAWISQYVTGGGRLWQSACNIVGTAPEPLIPGWVVSSDDNDNYNDVSDPGHRWVQGVPNPIFGTSASHDSFSNLYAGSQVIATAQTSGKPVLVDYAFGEGRVLITGQPLEFAWNFSWDGAPILQNSLLNLYADVLILQDSLPWGADSIQQVLENFGLAYETVDSTQFGTFDLAPYMMVVSPSSQPDSYYTPWNANIGWISQYVADGGRLWQSTCKAFSTVEALIPGGVVSADDLDNYNDIVDADHPWVHGVPNPMYDTYASHDSFTLLYPGSHVVATAQTSGKAVLVDYEYGLGRVLITGQALEWSWIYGNDGGPILENSIEDMLLKIFADGFESGDTTAWSSTVP